MPKLHDTLSAYSAFRSVRKLLLQMPEVSDELKQMLLGCESIELTVGSDSFDLRVTTGEDQGGGDRHILAYDGQFSRKPAVELAEKLDLVQQLKFNPDTNNVVWLDNALKYGDWSEDDYELLRLFAHALEEVVMIYDGTAVEYPEGQVWMKKILSLAGVQDLRCVTLKTDAGEDVQRWALVTDKYNYVLGTAHRDNEGEDQHG